MTPAQNPQLQSFWPASNTLRHSPRVLVTGRRGVLGPARRGEAARARRNPDRSR
ncbi:MAG: hypothetical protein WAW03_18555 [Anaerolineae bacterium]|uniref:hypothetical protein n=1 Tax=Candidatus Amarolinea dominans TaxID=3140696 RepID=UPI001DE27CC3|nr:hypothetical protein [Anaerolineae bacterium]MBK9091485.1 hypothetical protein [Anaerolineae bacterium]MBK9230410.1 hypothetical protein [Anaerolineae bacterium]